MKATNIACFSFLVICIVCSSFQMQTKKRIIFFGDSITELGVRPGGYIKKMDSMLRQKNQTNYELIGAGVSGNKVYDLFLRMESDVLEKNPAAVVIWIGVNDVWHKRLLGTGTDADKFERFYTAIINKLKSRNISVFICTPAVIGEKNDMSNEQDGDLNKYANIIRSIAQKNSLPLIDLRQIFLNHIKVYNPQNKDRGILTNDGVHLNEAGNTLVAQKMMETLTANIGK